MLELPVRPWPNMNREEALNLLRGGPGSVKRFNETRPQTLPDLRDADLNGTKLFKVNLSGADLRGAKLCRAELYWSDLSGANFREADLRGCRLSVANLRRANLFKTDLSGAHLRWTDLRGAELGQANFRNADLTGASLIWADLIETDLSKSNLSRTDLREARFGKTVVACSLNEAKALETIEHWGPSQISKYTIAQFQGNIPEDFLRGCGLTECEIRDAQLHDPNLTEQDIAQKQEAIENLRAHGPMFNGGVFISYSSTDAPFVDKLEQHLQNKGASVWRMVHDAENDQDSVKRQVVDIIRPCDTVILILSEQSCHRPWVETEFLRAMETLRENHLQEENPQLTLCTVAIDGSWKTLGDDPTSLFPQDDFPKESIFDFSKWDDGQQFAEIFESCLHNLRNYYAPIESDSENESEAA